MRTGLILDNCQTGLHETVAGTSFIKLQAMRAGAVGTLWIGGTKHNRSVYDECERRLSSPTYIVRIGGHRQTPDEWLAWARDAYEQIPPAARSRCVFVCGNEPNHPVEGYAGDPEGYGALYSAVVGRLPVPVAFACPTFGFDKLPPDPEERRAEQYIVKAGVKDPGFVIFNAYAHLVSYAAETVRRLFPRARLLVGEVNSLVGGRVVGFFPEAFRTLWQAGVEVALVFIAGGRSNGGWDERYIISEQEAAGLVWQDSPAPPQQPEEPMPYEYIQGFKVYHDEHPEIGGPTSALMYDANGNGLQYTETGRLEWNKQGNQVLFFRSSP